eukprot:299494_1
MKSGKNNTHRTPKPARLVYELQHQARVRTGHDLTSLHVTDLPEGTMVVADRVVHNRVRITHPIVGWISAFSKSGLQIIRKVNKETQKIGGKAIFAMQIPTNDHTNPYKFTRIECQIVDYNECYNMHKVQSENGFTRWLSLNDANITYVPKHKQIASEKVYPTRQTEALFEQCFCADYPQFAPPNVNPGVNVQISRNTEDGNQQQQEEETKEEEISSALTSPISLATIETQDYEETKENKPEIRSNTMPRNDEEILQKMREIEERIINHLHLRGYHEDDPDFWRYIAKAKEIAIVKVQKEREKWLESANSNDYVY